MFLTAEIPSKMDKDIDLDFGLVHWEVLGGLDIDSEAKGGGIPPGTSAAVDVLRGQLSREALSDPEAGYVGEPGEEPF